MDDRKGGNFRKLNNLFVFNAVVALAFGSGFALMPEIMGNIYGVDTSTSANLMGQFFGWN